MSYHDRPVSCPVLSSYLIVTPHRTHDSPDIYDIIFSGKLLFFFDIVKHFMIFVSYQLHNILKSPSTLSLSLLPCVTNIFFLRPLLLHSILCSIEVTMSIPISLSLSLSLSRSLSLSFLSLTCFLLSSERILLFYIICRTILRLSTPILIEN